MIEMFTKKTTNQVKALAILLLLFHHLFYKSETISRLNIQFYIIPQHYIQVIGVMSRICVWVFLFLSAFGLACSYIKYDGTTTSFIVKRYFTLMSSFWFIYLVSILLVYFSGKDVMQIYQGNYFYLIIDLLGLSDFFATPMLSGVWWYMGLAQILLATIPLLVKLVEKFGFHSIALMLAIMLFLPEGFKSEFGGLYTNYLISALLGVYSAKYNLIDRMNYTTKQYQKVAKGIIFTMAVIILIILKYKNNSDPFRLNSLISAIIVLLICCIAALLSANTNIKKGISFIGDHSGNIFMIHGILFVYFPELVYWSNYGLVIFLTLFILSLLISICVVKFKKIIKYDSIIMDISNKLLNLL